MSTGFLEFCGAADSPSAVRALRKQLFDELGAAGGLQIPVVPPAGDVLDDRKLPR